MFPSVDDTWERRDLQGERPINPPQVPLELTGTIPSESIRHLCLATASFGAVYWLALIREYPVGLLLVVTSVWIVARALGALRSHLVAAIVSLAFLLILLVADLPHPPPAQHALAEACPFARRAYVGMLVALVVADGLDLAQLCLHFRHVRSRWTWRTRHLESPGRAT